LRNDKNFSYVAAWEYTSSDKKPKLNKEPLTFEYVKPSERSYK
jgi:succinate dehydrogenase / fumarate reductase flavoprotein subunit